MQRNWSQEFWTLILWQYSSFSYAFCACLILLVKLSISLVERVGELNFLSCMLCNCILTTYEFTILCWWFEQRITMAEVIENEWFKKGYKPPSFEQPNIDLDDVDSIFNESMVRLVFPICSMMLWLMQLFWPAYMFLLVKRILETLLWRGEKKALLHLSLWMRLSWSPHLRDSTSVPFSKSKWYG